MRVRAARTIVEELRQQRKKMLNLLLFVDFKKAFDMLNWKLLMRKLMSYGFSNKALRLIENYFHKRGQQVKIDESMSSFIEQEDKGIAQGSITTGPLFFLVYQRCIMVPLINTLFNALINGNGNFNAINSIFLS